MQPETLVILGADINGLVAAAYLARLGLRPLVLAPSERLGGVVHTTAIAPGFRGPALYHTVSVDPAIVRDLDLVSHGLERLKTPAHLFAPAADGRGLVLWADATRAAKEIAAFSERDAESYPQFLASVARVARVLHTVSDQIPPNIDRTSARDLVSLLKAGRQFRGLGRRDAYRLLRWMPMAVADLVAEWFESEPLRAAIAGGGILGSCLGPRSAGTGAILLLLGASTGHPIANGWFARGGPGAVVDALAASACAAGAEIRAGVEVVSIDVENESVAGVTLWGGERIATRAVVSAASVTRTMLGLVDRVHLAPEFARRVGNIRTRGTLAKVNFAVRGLPAFAALAGRDAAEQQAAISGLIRLAPATDAIERAFDASKYGGLSDEPWVELAIPSISDPSLAPAGQHVVSAYVQYAPLALRGSTWDAERERLGDLVVGAIERYATGFARSIVARDVLAPTDLEQRFGLAGGHLFDGELALDQWFVARPLLGHARYETPIRNLFLCGSGTHPGTGPNGLSGRVAARAIGATLRQRA